MKLYDIKEKEIVKINLRYFKVEESRDKEFILSK